LLNGKNELTHYAFNTIKRGIDTVADPEVAEMNLLVAPGVTNPSLTTHMVEVSKERGDTLAIIDLEKDYIPRHEGLEDEFSRLPDPDLAISLLKDRRINNSYGCVYFPWVQVRDNINFSSLWVPPSVAALGTFAFSETRPGSELWFAPAGFNRGGLTSGAAGIPVTNVRYKLTSKERDKLYEANINPIASFPSEGIVVFGNKTLQVTPSALDRVNVRRLMIFLKKRVSRIASTILFDQNVQATWNRFKFKVEPLLADVKARFGLTDWKLVLDETTTTPDLIDRNILYAKIFLKPARAIEFIAIDFNITRTGASFTD
jgi:phage tail sheath protein FI